MCLSALRCAIDDLKIQGALRPMSRVKSKESPKTNNECVLIRSLCQDFSLATAWRASKENDSYIHAMNKNMIAELYFSVSCLHVEDPCIYQKQGG